MVQSSNDPQDGGNGAVPTGHPRDGYRSRRPRRRLRSAVAAAALALTVSGGVGAVAFRAVAAPSGAAAGTASVRPRPGQATGGNPAATATAQQQVGVVDIDTVLDYGAGRAAGTGLVVTPDGEILTNNHVVADSTAITVTVVSTGASYTASVVGTDTGDDIAVLRLANASGLTPAVLAGSAQAAAAQQPGTGVTAVGNAGGTGGTPSAAAGTVVAADRTITAADETGGNAENLSGMIEVDAAIEAGDSGGPLYAGGAVIGIDTAASEPDGPSYRTTAYSGASAPVTGYAIPITRALDVAGRITSGEQDSTIRQGYPAFLGVEVTPTRNGSAADGTTDGTGDDTAGAPVSGVVDSSPAAAAGLGAGDTIVSLDGRSVASPDQLTAALADRQVGDRVSVEWLDPAGATHTATVSLAAGPAR